MKKIWILEKFETVEEMAKSYEEMTKSLEERNIEKDKVESFKEKYKKLLEENPNGIWCGFEGKTNYHQFCEIAKHAIRRNPKGKFRVVEGIIDDNSKYWIEYEFVKENEKVFKYLMATLRYI